MRRPVKFDLDLDLKRNAYEGLYIAIEGIDGCGKSTQVENLAKWFRKRGRDVVITSEPRKEESIVGKIIHDALKSKLKLTPLCFQDLYSAERVINHELVIIPALKKGNIVLSHRCFWSAVAYGVFDKGETRYTLKNSNIIMVANGILSQYYQFIAPDFTFYLSVSANTAIDRIIKMGKTRELYEDKEKLSRIIAGYRWLLKKFPKEIIMVSGDRYKEEVTEEIITKIQNSESRIKN